jgi:5-methylcytosine-specific restriction endonuclease McrA
MPAKRSINREVTMAEKLSEASLIERSEVPANRPYNEYKETLRVDFIYACAYCTMTEFEAQGIRMTIDHYEPKSERTELINNYENLMYSCDDCNMLKGDRYPPQAARDAGHRFFRPDQDYRHEHFEKDSESMALEGISNVGRFTIECIDLNRLTLLRLRKIRERLENCHQHVLHGVLGLKRFHIDQLPPSIRARAQQRISQWGDMSENYANDIDSVLRGIAYSPMIDRDPEKEARAERRAAKQKKLEGLYPGESWRRPRGTNRRKSR